jgi:hypothetical protein
MEHIKFKKVFLLSELLTASENKFILSQGSNDEG